MKHAMAATWKMALEGVRKGFAALSETDDLRHALAETITHVENDPDIHSVGFGGLPNRECVVETDAAYMVGDDLSFGAIMGASGIKNPILVAQSLAKYSRNCVLCGKGADDYAQRCGFEFTNMLTRESQEKWAETRRTDPDMIEAYRESHDTVCVLGKCDDHLEVGVSTSGLFMKRPGRVGDSPIIGSGLYCDSEVGSAAATGLGEDIMKGCLSYEIVRQLKQGVPVQTACENAMRDHVQSMTRRGRTIGGMSVLAMDREGNFGAASNIPFPFIYQNDDTPIAIYIAEPQEDGTMKITKQ